MTATTNKITIEYLNRKKIEKDYYIFKVFSESTKTETKDEKNLFYKNFKEFLGENKFKSQSVVYKYPQSAYVFFKKDNFNFELFQNVLNKGFEGNILKFIDVDIQNEKYIEDLDLLQLLANAIPNEINEEEDVYNNITGSLFVLNNKSFPIKGKVFTAYEIQFQKLKRYEKEYVLNLKTASFFPLNMFLSKEEKIDLKHKAIYIIDKDTNDFRKLLPKEKEKYDNDQKYIHQSPFKTKNKNVAKWIDLKNHSTFINSKCGMLYKFVKEFNEIFGKYAKISLYELPETYSERKINQKNGITTKNYCIKKLNGLGINIIDTIQNDNSNSILKLVEDGFKQMNVYDIGKNKLDGQLVLKLIHDIDYYKGSEKDAHEKLLNTQHFCYETFLDSEKEVVKEIDKNIILKMLFELVVKNDISKNKISLYSFENFKECVKYVSRHKRMKSNDTEFYFLEMLIQPDGTFTFSKIVKNDKKWKEYSKIFSDFHSEYTYLEKIELYCEYMNFKALFIDTGTVVLPNNMEKINARLSKYGKEKMITKNKLINLICKFKEYIKNTESAESEKILKDIDESLIKIRHSNKQLFQYSEVIRNGTKSKNEFGYEENIRDEPLINLRTMYGKRLNHYLIQNENIVLNPALKNKQDDFFSVMRSIHVIEKNENEYLYWVASKQAMKQAVTKSNHIRKLMIIDDEGNGINKDEFVTNLFDQLLVDFVKNNEFTVVSFVNKYMRDCENYLDVLPKMDIEKDKTY